MYEKSILFTYPYIINLRLPSPCPGGVYGINVRPQWQRHGTRMGGGL